MRRSSTAAASSGEETCFALRAGTTTAQSEQAGISVSFPSALPRATQLETHDRVVFAGLLCSVGMARVRPRVIVSRKLAMPSIHHSCAQECTVLTVTAHRDTDWVCRGVGQVSAGISRKQCETAQACAPCECKQRQEQRLHAKSYLVRLVKL